MKINDTFTYFFISINMVLTGLVEDFIVGPDDASL